MSAYIAGPANFPVQRAEKANDAERKRMEELTEWQERAQHAVKRNLGLLPPSGVITSDDPEALEKLRKKLADREKMQEVMKAANKNVRDRKMTDAEKISALMDGGSSSLGKLSFSRFRFLYAFQQQSGNPPAAGPPGSA